MARKLFPGLLKLSGIGRVHPGIPQLLGYLNIPLSFSELSLKEYVLTDAYIQLPQRLAALLGSV